MRTRWLPILVATLVVACSTTGSEPRGSGTASIGDRYFPDSGNGGYDVTHYDLSIRYTPKHPEIRAVAALDITATTKLATFNLDLLGLTVDRITVDDERAHFHRAGGELTIRPRREINAGRAFEVEVLYHGVPKPIRDPSEANPADAVRLGWHRTRTGDVYVVSEPTGARTWFPSNDHPADKATFSFALDVPTTVAAAANGRLQRGPRRRGRIVWRWTMPQPMATYLATVVVAPMREQRTQSPAGVPIRNFFPTDSYDDAVQDFAATGEMVDTFATLFGPYPFDEYGAVVPAHAFGYALETQTLSIFGEDMLGTDIDAQLTVAHELAHQWFGDSVSISRWRDIWLNEGAATYAQMLWEAHIDPTYDIDRAARNLRASEAEELTRPRDPGPGRLFTSAVYDRGALVFHALRRTIGDDTFFATLQGWTAKYRYGNATTEDFIALTEATAGRSLTGFFRSWLDANAVPRLPR